MKTNDSLKRRGKSIEAQMKNSEEEIGNRESALVSKETSGDEGLKGNEILATPFLCCTHVYLYVFSSLLSLSFL
jgi:hypothetical protein